MDRMLDGVEKAGNKVPHPVMMFLYLIILVIALSVILAAFDVSVSEEVAVPGPGDTVSQLEQELGGSILVYDPETFYEIDVPEFTVQEETYEVHSLLAVDGLRFMFSSFVNNFAGFGVVAVTFVAMMGVGVAEHAGMMAALIRKLVAVAPAALLAFFLIFVGVLSSVASDAGYLILIPLAAAAFASVGRHPLAGLAAAFAGVGCIFAVNLIITPVDSMLTELTNDVLPAGSEPLTVTANYYFSVASSILMAIVAVIVTQRVVEPRLGAYDPTEGDPDWQAGAEAVDDEGRAAEARGLRYSLYGLLAMLLLIVLLVAPPGAPLREPGTGDIIGNTPFMQSLIFLITLIFLVCGICYGLGAGTVTSSNDVITGVTKTFAGLAGLIFMLLMISQFIAFFNYTNIPRVAAVELAHLLERAGWGALPLLIGFIVVIIVLDIIIPGVVPKWAIFAPVFIPIFLRLGVAPQTVLAAYRVGDSPMNVVTPLMVYLPFIVTVAQRYQKKAGIGTIIALMVPYVVAIAVAWIALFAIWWLLGLPVGPGFPIEL
jgi:aminobenzoyl-glutamate transport protein